MHLYTVSAQLPRQADQGKIASSVRVDDTSASHSSVNTVSDAWLRSDARRQPSAVGFARMQFSSRALLVQLLRRRCTVMRTHTQRIQAATAWATPYNELNCTRDRCALFACV